MYSYYTCTYLYDNYFLLLYCPDPNRLERKILVHLIQCVFTNNCLFTLIREVCHNLLPQVSLKHQTNGPEY